MRTKRIFMVAGILLALIVGYRFVRFVQRKMAERKVTVVEKRVPVRVRTVASGEIEDVIDFVGTIQGLNEVNVLSKVPGKLLRKVVTEGKYVKAGDVIAIVDRDEPAFDYKEAEVTAPISGTLTGYFIDAGQTINPQTPLAMIADMSKAKVVVNVPEKELLRIEMNDTAHVNVDAYPNRVFRGSVKLIEARVDQETRTAEVNIEVDNKDGALKTGMFAKGKIVKKKYRGILVPLEAVLSELDTSVVYTIDNGTAKKHTVKTGIIQDSTIEVTAGLKVGDELIVEGQDNVREGDRVEVVK